MSRRPLRRSLLSSQLIAALLLGAGAAWLWAATPTEQFRSDPDRLVIVTAHWNDRAQLQQIAGRFEHVVVDGKAHTARMEASAGDLAMLRRMGVRVEIDDTATARMRTAEAAMAQRATIARQHLAPDGTMSAQGLEATQIAAQSAIPGYACFRTVL